MHIITKELGVKYMKYTVPYHPASNGGIEGFHAFLKACIAKHVSQKLEWNVVIPLTCAAYNLLPNEHTREFSFYIMFGRDPILPLNTLIAPKCQCLGNDLNLLSLEYLKNIFEIAATNLKKAHSKRDPITPQLPTKLKEDDRVLIKNQAAGPFDPRYVGDYSIVRLKGNQVELRPAEGGKCK